LRRLSAQVLQAVIQGIAFADPGQVMSFDDFGPGRGRHNGRSIRAVVGNDQKTVAGADLRPDIVQCCSNAGAFVVCRYQYRNARPELAVARRDRCCHAS